MQNHRYITFLFMALTLGFFATCSKDKGSAGQPDPNAASATLKKAAANDSVLIDSVSVFASNIAFPRGLKFSPDGNLYVALGGFGGKDSTIGICTQVIAPVGPYKSGNTSEIIKIGRDGTVSPVVNHLPSEVNALGFTSGASDVAFIGDNLYALLVAGCSHGIANTPSSVIKVNQQDSSWSVVADISAYLATHPVAAPEADDFEPDGDPYSLIFVRGDFYAIEPNHGELMKVTKQGDITRVLDFSAHFGHIVPTSVTFHDEHFYVGNLRTFPLVAGSSSIYKVSLNGQVEVFATGFTGILGVAFDRFDRLYVLETSAGGGPTPNTGRVVRINKDHSKQIVVDKLNFPTAITFGPDGALYISNTGFGPPTGSIVKVTLKKEKSEQGEKHHGKKDDN